jgi:hypothetical protein
MGYFGMIDCADVFVFYDDVQFVERSWQRRNRVKLPNGKVTWLSVPVKSKFGQKINEVKISSSPDWKRKHWQTLKHAYGRAPSFREFETMFEEIYATTWEWLSDLNVTLTKRISERLGIRTTKFVSSSQLNISGQKTDRLIGVLKAIGANEYVSGPAANSYIEIEKFREERIELYWYEFDHPTYPQVHGEFLSHLSVVDLMFNVGDKALGTIRAGGEKALKKAWNGNALAAG